MIGIIDNNMGNLQSVVNALDFLNIKNKVIILPEEVIGFKKIIFPGVGAFPQAMKNLERTGMKQTLTEYVQNKQGLLLGICLGMQLLYESSDEHGNHQGLGFIRGHVKYFGDQVKDLVIPHVGWNSVKKQNGSKLLSTIADDSDFYFVHSFYCQAESTDVVAGTTEYGIRFDSVVEKDNVFGCQFHPEKSQKVGLNLFRNFETLPC